MRLYTIAKALVLSLGAISVIARSLPERRSEIDSRIAGEHDFSNSLKKLEAADAKVDTAVSKVTTPATTTSIDDLKHRLKGMGLVMISEGMIDEKVYTGTYSIPANNTFPLGSTILEKRKKNIEGETCELNCGSTGDVLGPVNDDCATLFNLFTTYPNQFRVGVGIAKAKSFIYKSCATWLVNHTRHTIVYNIEEFGNVTQRLNEKCMKKGTEVGFCTFGKFRFDFKHLAYVGISSPDYHFW